MSAASAASAATTAAAADTPSAWSTLAQTDIDFAAETMRRQSIMAIYPAPSAFERQLAAARQAVSAELPKVANFEGYRQVMKHYIGTFSDMHLSFSPSLAATTYRWPAFIAIYRGHRFVTAASTGAVANDLEITDCDGHALADLAAQVATYEGYVAGLESTKASAAPLVLRDAGSPFVTPPARCTIGSKPVKLDWRPVAPAVFNAAIDTTRFPQDHVVAATPFGTDGAWVRMGVFQPTTQAEGQAFHKLIEDAPTLRDKSVIVLDVRANGGGPYEWMMGFIRALYGADYANYYARARLEIAPVYRTTPAILAFYRSGEEAETGALKPPADGVPFDEHDVMYEQALRAGKPVFAGPKNPQQVPKPARAQLPSGNGSIGVPTMTRDGRRRDDNVPQQPAHEFMGNIADTNAVQAWIRAGFAE